ncbi:DUF4037 domain-containing protein [Paenibacillus pini]|uniref:DUF4037 domain-containing protein n=1 Tax=Paenibacillus pini JCM 16418 TaxID=1236976 RepID=W7YDR6_9BACL|nr:DUF4037 domain-containing protein [Paenibacillus pini]GAF06587.1 hypothetical protein JCM16418_554 [Paenibacillus pini JCM 16418]
MTYIKGIELSKRFHFEFVEPLVSKHFPSLRYASALIGAGSEVLGYDTEMSADHDWGPRVLLFLQEQQNSMFEEIFQCLKSNAPEEFYGFSVDLKQTVITSLPRFLKGKLGADISKELQSMDWLTFPAQVLAEIVGGAVYRDDTGQLTRVRKQLEYYPQDIWLFLMASIWNRIGQEEHLVLRSGYVGDELGSSIIASRIVRDIMNLCFLMEKRYAPYPKWFGTAFEKLDCAKELLPILRDVQIAETWKLREEALCKAYEYIAYKHNLMGITDRIDEKVTLFYDRPFRIIQGSKIAEAITKSINDPTIRKLKEKIIIGGIDQITDNTDFLLINQWFNSKNSTERNLLRLVYEKILE